MNLNKTNGRLHIRGFAAILGVCALLLGGCRTSQSPTPPPVVASPTLKTALPPEATPTSLPPSPSPTTEPLAARVNGEPLPLQTYQDELARYLDARATLDLPAQETADASAQVLDELIGQVLLAQAARQAGYQPDEAVLESTLTRMRNQALPDWETWLQNNHYTEESLRQALKQQLAAAWMRDKVIASVPETMLQVHARQILLYNRDDALQVYAQLQNGTDFATLAAQFDPVGLGDLGWFPQGMLAFPQIEAAAFSLSPGEYSEVIETSLGFHIVQVVERDAQRPLSTDARLYLQQAALQDWLNNQRQQSQVEILVP
ncbi:MAG: hypothetical protein D6755_01860 [Anaerolineae bacterium]|nr:MAG: hypothetical protein D6755_01860 [Anaerolineae bacterium]